MLVPSLKLDSVGELGDLVIDRAALGHELADLAVSMHHCGVVAAAEGLPDLGKREIGELTAEIHSDLAGIDQDAAAV